MRSSVNISISRRWFQKISPGEHVTPSHIVIIKKCGRAQMNFSNSQLNGAPNVEWPYSPALIPNETALPLEKKKGNSKPEENKKATCRK